MSVGAVSPNIHVGISPITAKAIGRLMKYNFPVKSISSPILLKELAEGWDSAHLGLIQEFLHRWAGCLSSHVDVGITGHNTQLFITYLTGLRLRNMDQVPCCLLSGDSDLSDTIWKFYRENSSPEFFPFFLTLSESAFNQ